MDPLIVLVNELQHASDTIVKYEHELSICEAQSNFTPNNARYQRLATEKLEVIKSVTKMRTELTEREGGTAYFLDQANVRAAPSQPPADMEINIDDVVETVRPQFPPYPRTPPPQPVARSESVPPPAPPLSPPPTAPSLYIEHTAPRTPATAPEHLVDLSKYTQAKAQLAHIMREHSVHHVHFVGLDDHVIAVPEHNEIRRYVKAGQDPARHMKGEYRNFIVGYNKSTRSYVQNKLFFPEYHPY